MGVKQRGCIAKFKRLTGTVGKSAFSAIVRGATVERRHKKVPGYVQSNGDIHFLSGVVYAKRQDEKEGRGTEEKKTGGGDEGGKEEKEGKGEKEKRKQVGGEKGGKPK